MHPAPNVEGFVLGFVQWLRLIIEIMGAAAIAIGSAISVWRFFRSIITQKQTDFNGIRLTLARYLTLALEFQLGADILSTAIAPSWQEIGKLGAIAVIRTGLNFFLSREIKEERKVSAGDASGEHKTDE